jgi:hypothetical protein
LPKKTELLRKEFLTQIENLYPKLMGNNHIQNLDFFLSSSCLMQLVAPFIQKSLTLIKDQRKEQQMTDGDKLTRYGFMVYGL